MISPFDMGPLNGGLLLLLCVAMSVVAVLSLRKVHRGEPVAVVGVAVALLLPLALVTWSSTWQHDSGMDWAMNEPRYLYRQTFMAMILARTVATQTYAGLAVVLGGLGVLGGAVGLTVRGERPRWLVGGIAASLGIMMVSAAAVSMSAWPAVVTGVRVGAYAVVAAVAVAALVSAHRRGPGVQLATLAAVVLPLVVVGADLTTLGSIAYIRISEVAVTAPPQKAELMAQAVQALDGMHVSAFVGLGLSAVMSLLGPAVAWRREKPHAAAAAAALGAVVLIAALGLSWSMHWTLPLRW